MTKPTDPTLFDLLTDLATLDRFTEFHRNNPGVYQALVRLAREWIASTGQHKLGIKALYERARWEIVITTGATDFKLNNDYTAYYARLIMTQEPDLADMFNLRKSAADEIYPVRVAV